jgi:hypothetical protein
MTSLPISVGLSTPSWLFDWKKIVRGFGGAPQLGGT